MQILNAINSYDYLFENNANAGEPRFNPTVRDNNRQDFDNLPDFSDFYTNPRNLDSTDILHGSQGQDAFKFNFTLWGRKEARERATHNNGELDKRWLGGMNEYYHAHYVQSIGNDYIVNFSSRGGDVIVLDGHHVDFTVLYSDDRYTRLGLFVDHGYDRWYNNNAEDGDVLGTLNIIGDFNPSSVYLVDTYV
jgi:hypothetical protein